MSKGQPIQIGMWFTLHHAAPRAHIDLDEFQSWCITSAANADTAAWVLENLQFIVELRGDMTVRGVKYGWSQDFRVKPNPHYNPDDTVRQYRFALEHKGLGRLSLGAECTKVTNRRVLNAFSSLVLDLELPFHVPTVLEALCPAVDDPDWSDVPWSAAARDLNWRIMRRADNLEAAGAKMREPINIPSAP